jgi:hypothetical protein
MALTDLIVKYQGASATLYVTISKLSDYTIWNGSAFVTWAAGDIASYDVALADQGNDTYKVAFPSTIAAGNYLVSYYEMAGATPAITDLHLMSEKVHWDGTALADVSTVTLSAYALTTLVGVKRHMNISATTYDTKLTELINFVSAQIETITGRKFKARDYRLWFNGMDQKRLVLRNPPVQTINRLSYGAANALTLSYTGSAIRANASVYNDPEAYEAGGVKLVSVSSAGTRTTNSLTFASYPSVSTLVAAIDAVTDWTATTVVDFPSYDLKPTGAQDALNKTVYLNYPDIDENGYTVDYRRALVEFSRSADWPWEQGCRMTFPDRHQDILCEYRAGYETIPGDVELVCREMVKEVYSQSTGDTSVKSSTLGPFSVEWRDDQTTYVKNRLAHYVDYFVGGAA